MPNAKAAKQKLKDVQQVINDMLFSYGYSRCPPEIVSREVRHGERTVSTREAIEAIEIILELPSRNAESGATGTLRRPSRISKSEDILQEIRQVMVDMQYSYRRKLAPYDSVSCHVHHGDSLVSRVDAVEQIEEILGKSVRRARRSTSPCAEP